MKKLLISLSAAVCLISFSTSHATEYTFTSHLDQFKVDVSDGHVTYNGEQVSDEPFKLIKPLFDSDLVTPCASGLGKWDLTVSKKNGDKEDKRIIYIEKKMASDGHNCSDITGPGLYQLPLHHSWFAEKKNVTIGLRNSFSIWSDKKQVVAFEKVNGVWKNKDKSFLTNWSFFAKFVEGLTQIPIDFRLHNAADKSASASFELRQEGRVFNFIKVSDKTWAVKFPESPWYAASGQLIVLDEVTPTIWESPYSATLKVVTDKASPEATRVAAVRSLSSNSSLDVKYAFFQVLETADENSEVIKEIATTLRKKPTDENFKMLVDALQLAKDQDVQNHITKILRIRNPKGPTISLDDPDDAALAKKKIWLQWKKSIR